MALINSSIARSRSPRYRKDKEHFSLAPGFAGERAGVRGMLESRSNVDIPPFSMGSSNKTSAKRSDVRPLTLALSPEYRGEGTIETPYSCDVRSTKTHVIEKFLWAMIFIGGIFLQTPELFGQIPEQRYAEANNSFAQPPNGSSHHSDPGIWHPPTRTAGVRAPEASTVAPAAWTTPISQSQTQAFQSSAPIATSQSTVPFKPPTSNPAASGIKKPGSAWSSMISMMVSLLLVLALFLGVAWFFRRVAPQPSRGLSKDVVQVLGRTPLAPRHNMILIRFGRKLVLVSQQLGQTQTLSEIDDPREVDHLLGLCEEASSTSISSSFRDVLFQLASGKGTDRRSANAKNLSIAREG